MQSVFNRGHGLRAGTRFKDGGDWPLDSNFLQSHLVRM